MLPRITSRLTRSVTATTLLLAAGCSTAMQRRDALSRFSDVSMTSAQLRYRVFAQVRAFVEVIEQTADALASRQPECGRLALQWKLGATGAALSRSFHPDPVLGLIASWSLARGMRCYFETGNGRNLFGAAQGEVVATSRRLEAGFRSIVASAAPERVAGAEARLAQWCDAHPMIDLHFALETTGAETVDFLASSGIDVFSALGSIEERTQYLAELIPILASIVTKQARWQAERVIDETLGSATISTLVAKLTAMEASMQRIAGVAASLPEIVAGEREQVLTALDRQRVLAVGDIGKQRELAVAAVRTEITNVEAILARGREEVFTAIDRQRTAAMGAIGEERHAAFAALEQLLEKALQRAPQAADAVVARYWWRTVLFACALAALGCGAAYLLSRDLVRRRSIP